MRLKAPMNRSQDFSWAKVGYPLPAGQTSTSDCARKGLAGQLGSTVTGSWQSGESAEDTLHRARIAYEKLLANCCHYDGLLSILMQHRPYFEALPSVRRPENSMVAIPLPNVRSRETSETGGLIDTSYRIRQLPCDIAIMMCDPEWKIKTGIEIVVFIQRPGEDFSDLLRRWRQTQVELGQGVEWLMPRRHKHLLAEGTETPHPLFVVFTEAEDSDRTARDRRIMRGLEGASLPVAIKVREPEGKPESEPKSESDQFDMETLT